MTSVDVENSGIDARYSTSSHGAEKVVQHPCSKSDFPISPRISPERCNDTERSLGQTAALLCAVHCVCTLETELSLALVI